MVSPILVIIKSSLGSTDCEVFCVFQSALLFSSFTINSPECKHYQDLRNLRVLRYTAHAAGEVSNLDSTGCWVSPNYIEKE